MPKLVALAFPARWGLVPTAPTQPKTKTIPSSISIFSQSNPLTRLQSSMPTVYQLKPYSQNLLRPIVPWLAKMGVTPNQVTIFTTCLAIACGCLVLWHNYFLILVPLLILVRAALNVIDGVLAREHHMKSTLGAILNELADVIFDAAIYLPFGLLPGVSGCLVAVIVVLSIISEMTGVLGLTVGGQRQYDGPMYKTDRGVMSTLR